MKLTKPPMGWNTWNTFGKDINEELILQTADALIEKGYKDAGYEYVIIDDCWQLRERKDGKLVPNPKLFPRGIKYIADYLHSKGLKLGIYSSSGSLTCEQFPGSFGYETVDADQFAQWGVDYLKYDYCHFPATADTRTAYLAMAMALKNSGRDIVFAACNWGEKQAEAWMRARGADTYRSTGDIFDNKKSICDIFRSQTEKIGFSGGGMYNDMDMLVVGMHGKGNAALGGCGDEEYLFHFAAWAFMGSPLIIGADIRNIADSDRAVLQNTGLIAINQDVESRPPFLIGTGGNLDGNMHRRVTMMRLLSGGKFALGIFNMESDDYKTLAVPFADMGLPANAVVRFKDAVTGESLGAFEGSFLDVVEPMRCRVVVGELIK